MATFTYKDAVLALIKMQLDDLETGAVPISDYYVRVRDTYRFDVSGDEIRRYLRDKIKRQSYPQKWHF